MKCTLTSLSLHPSLHLQLLTQGTPSRFLSTPTPILDTPIKVTRNLGHLIYRDNPLCMPHSPRWLALTLRNHGQVHILRIQNIPILNHMLQNLQHVHMPGTLKILPLRSAIIQRVQYSLNTPTTHVLVIFMCKSLIGVTEQLELCLFREQGSLPDTCLLRT